MNKYISNRSLILLITSIISACSLNKCVIGEYDSRKSNILREILGRSDYYTYERMLISKDSTFEFESGGCLETVTYSGLWRIQTDTLYLKANEFVNKFVPMYSVDRGRLKPIINQEGLFVVYELRKK